MGRWCGSGAPAAGKSTVARALARRYGLRLRERLVRRRIADYRSPGLAEH